MAVFEFPFRTGKVTIDYEKCHDCASYACVKACSLFGSSLFKVEDGIPVLVFSPGEAERRCVEDLTCELYCQDQGNKALKIILDMFGLEEYKQKIGLN